MTIRPTDKEAIALSRKLIDEARFGAIAVEHPETNAPHVTRIAVGTDPEGAPITLISDLSIHTAALRKNPKCSLLLGEPESKGDPLTYPRITLICTAEPVDKSLLRDHYLTTHPKSQLYIDFADFNFVRFKVSAADLNGGFGKAFRLTPEDLNL